MTSNMILTKLDFCYYCYIRYFLLNTIFNAIAALYELILLMGVLLSLEYSLMREIVNYVLIRHNKKHTTQNKHQQRVDI